MSDLLENGVENRSIKAIIVKLCAHMSHESLLIHRQNYQLYALLAGLVKWECIYNQKKVQTFITLCIQKIVYAVEAINGVLTGDLKGCLNLDLDFGLLALSLQIDTGNCILNLVTNMPI